MKYIKPDFYDAFHCIASRCRHSCCVGWEIDIDGDTADLYSSDEPLDFIVEDDGEADGDSPEEARIYALRGKVLNILSDRAMPLHERMCAACKLCGADMPSLDIGRWAELYSGLERLHASWGDALNKLRDIGSFTVPNSPHYERLTAYFVYRHFSAPESIRFAVLSTAIVAALDFVTPSGEHEENLRMYSEEIEYSDENINKIFTFMDSIC